MNPLYFALVGCGVLPFGGKDGDAEDVDPGTDPTDPLDDDRDADGLSDLDEGALGTDADLPDTDGDGLLDGPEVDDGTDPTLADTDGGGAEDGIEAAAGTDPLDPLDDDGDGAMDRELYFDLALDPGEFVNLIDDPARQCELGPFRAALAAELL